MYDQLWSTGQNKHPCNAVPFLQKQPKENSWGKCKSKASILMIKPQYSLILHQLSALELTELAARSI